MNTLTYLTQPGCRTEEWHHVIYLLTEKATCVVTTKVSSLCNKTTFRAANISVIIINLSLLYLYRARNKITQLSIPTHAQLQRHRLKFIKNHIKNSYMFRSTTIFRDAALARTRTLGRSSSTTRYRQHDMLPHQQA